MIRYSRQNCGTLYIIMRCNIAEFYLKIMDEKNLMITEC